MYSVQVFPMLISLFILLLHCMPAQPGSWGNAKFEQQLTLGALYSHIWPWVSQANSLRRENV